jgi:beta-glucanase (GH16 family)
MANLKLILGLYPKTSSHEEKLNALREEYRAYNEFTNSTELKRYQELDHFMSSGEYLEAKRTIEALSYTNTPEYTSEQEYLRLKKSSEITLYYKFIQSADFQRYTRIASSSDLSRFRELKEFVNSDEYIALKAYAADKKRFRKTPEFLKLEEYNSLASNESIRNYYKFIQNKHYSGFIKLFRSKELAEYEESKQYLDSSEFIKNKASLSKNEFKATSDFAKQVFVVNFSSTAAYKSYYRLAKSKEYGDFVKLENSNEIEYFEGLKKEVLSPDFKAKQRSIEKFRIEDTPEYRKYQEYKKLESSSDIKFYHKIIESKAFKNFERLHGSSDISRFEELEKLVASKEFLEVKNYMLDKKKFEKSEAYQKHQEYLLLKKHPKIVWYQKLTGSPKFDWVKQWDLAFEDDFAGSAIDKNKWISRYFWGDAILQEAYSLADEKQAYKEQNLKTSGSVLEIITKKEKAKSKAWNPMIGFIPKEFEYTSGMINSGQSHRQQYGLIEIKARLNNSSPVVHAGWMVGEKMVPHVDIFKLSGNKIALGTFWGDASSENIQKDHSRVPASRICKDYHIFSLEWTPGKMVWKVNGLVLKTQTSGLPETPMYISLSSSLFEDADPGRLPAKMEVDWVRCYSLKSE